MGYSVLAMVRAMEGASGRKINYVLGERRPGDLAEVYSDPKKVRHSTTIPSYHIMSGETRTFLETMCRVAVVA